MSKKRTLPFIFFFVVCMLTYGQEEFNVQNLTPSSLLPIGKWEFKSFTGYYTQTEFFNEKGRRQDAAGGPLFNDNGTIKSTPNILRSTFFTSVNQIGYGLSSKLNVGLEFWISSSALSSAETSRFSAIDFKQTANSRTALSYVGARIKFVPIQSISNFSMQSLFLIPVASDLEGHQTPQPFVNWDNYFWMNQFFLDIPLSDQWLLFLNVDLVWGISRNEAVDNLRSNRFTIPAKVFFNYFATPKLTLQLQTEYNRILQAFGDKETREVNDAYYFQLGSAVKYQLISGKLEGEIGYNYFLEGNNGQGAGNSLNLGIRVLL